MAFELCIAVATVVRTADLRTTSVQHDDCKCKVAHHIFTFNHPQFKALSQRNDSCSVQKKNILLLLLNLIFENQQSKIKSNATVR